MTNTQAKDIHTQYSNLLDLEYDKQPLIFKPELQKSPRGGFAGKKSCSNHLSLEAMKQGVKFQRHILKILYTFVVTNNSNYGHIACHSGRVDQLMIPGCMLVRSEPFTVYNYSVLITSTSPSILCIYLPIIYMYM